MEEMDSDLDELKYNFSSSFSVIHVMPDEIQKCRAVLQSMLPRESMSKETDAALFTGMYSFSSYELLIELSIFDCIARSQRVSYNLQYTTIKIGIGTCSFSVDLNTDQTYMFISLQNATTYLKKFDKNKE